MADRLSAALANHRTAVAAIREMYPEASEDDLADTITGASTLDEAIIATLREALYREAQAAAIEHLIDRLKERQQRFRNTAQAMRAACLQAAQEGGLTMPLRAPDMTIGIGISPGRVIVIDEELIPQELKCVRIEPNLAAIRVKLKAGETVPGCELGNGTPALRVNTK